MIEHQRRDPTMNPMARAAAVACPGFARTHWPSSSVAAVAVCARGPRFVGLRKAKRVKTAADIAIAAATVAAAAAGDISTQREMNAA
jgi:hypothetical protein